MAARRDRKSWNIRNAFVHSFHDLKDVKDGTGVIRWKDLKLHAFESNPYDYIQVLYKSRQQKVPRPTIDQWQSQLLMALHLKYLERRLVNNNFDTITSLNSHNTTKVKNGQLVAFRCFLQDDIGPEYSPAEYTIVNPITGKEEKGSTLLKDYSYKGDSMEGFISEKDVFVGVTPPAENLWVNQEHEEDNDLSPEEKKRLKKSKKDKALVALPHYRDIIPSIFTEVGETKPMACRLKIYKTSNENWKFKTNDVLQVVGLIQMPDPVSNSATRDAEEEVIPCDIAKLPVLHVFSAIRLAEGNPNVLWLDVKAFPLLNLSNIDVKACAGDLRHILSLSLGGDTIAASYAMMAMIAQNPDESLGLGTNPIGKYVVNISGILEISEIVNLFTKVVKALTPRTLRFDFTIDNVNGARLIPTKNMQTNVLETGLLQLPEGTQMIIDETKLNEGKFEDHGCRNLMTLKDLLTDQEVKYNYTRQHPSIRADFPTIVLSTSMSVMPSDVRVPISCVREMYNRDKNRGSKIDDFLKEKSDKLRYYITLSQLIVKHSLYGFDSTDPQLEEDITEFLVHRHNSELYNNKMSSSEFAAFVSSCRLWGILHGHSNRITREGFEAMRDFERIRDSRIPRSTPANPI